MTLNWEQASQSAAGPEKPDHRPHPQTSIGLNLHFKQTPRWCCWWCWLTLWETLFWSDLGINSLEENKWLRSVGSMLPGPHPLFPLFDFHRAARATWLIYPAEGTGPTAHCSLHPPASRPRLLQVALIGSLSLVSSSEGGRGHRSSQSLQLGQTMKYNVRHQTSSLGMRQQGSGVMPLKGQRFLGPRILNTSSTAQGHELARVQGIREPSSPVCSVVVFIYLLKKFFLMFIGI